MISQITLKNFKSIKNATLDLGPFNLFIGTNASGKSNFLDALRFFQGIGWEKSGDSIDVWCLRHGLTYEKDARG